MLPTWLVFVATTLLVVVTLEIGYRLGLRTHKRSPKEKESAVGAFAAAMLGLLAFMLGFSFNLVAERYQTRKTKVRDEVNSIETAYLRTDFLPQPDRHESRELLEGYVAAIVDSPPSAETPEAEVKRALALSNVWHRRLWAIAVANAKRDLDSDVGALYTEAINTVFTLRSERAMVELSEKIRLPIWLALYGLTILAVLAVAYQVGIAGSKRSKVGFCLAASFALVLSLIADLDRVGGYIKVSQQPFEALLSSIRETQQAER